MKKIIIPKTEHWDPINEVFIELDEVVLCIEHSLVSISKWESIWKKPFLSREEKTYEETISYIKCMTLTQNVDPSVYGRIPSPIFKEIADYIDDPMTATTFTRKEGQGGGRKIITSEQIYSWMIALSIPVDFQKWHLNRLLTLIRVCNENNSPQKSMSKSEIMRRNSALNASRRKALGSRG